MAAEYTIRKNALRLTEKEREAFIHAVWTLKENGIYDRYVSWHSAAGRFQTPPGPVVEQPNTRRFHPRSGNEEMAENLHGSHGDRRNAAHIGPAFLPWHRYFLLRFEQDLQSVDPSVTLPYWDWAADSELEDPASSPIWSPDFMGGNGNPRWDFLVEDGPFATERWQVLDEAGNTAGGLRRNFASSPEVATLPTQEDVEEVLLVTPYDQEPWDSTSNPSFRNLLEGFGGEEPQLHNRVHGWVGGHMGSVPTSPNDPVFFLHHANVDRIWTMWKLRHRQERYMPRKGGPFSHNLHDPMFPWNVTPREMLNHRRLGYIYDTERKKAIKE